MAVIEIKHIQSSIEARSISTLSYISSTLASVPVPTATANYDPVATNTPTSAVVVTRIPSTFRGQRLDSKKQETVNDALYNRFLKAQNANLLSDSVPLTSPDTDNDTYILFELWNGFHTDEEITNITYSSSVGVSLTDLFVGDLLRKFSGYDVTILITGAGVAVFSVDITITTTNHTYVIKVQGTRAAEEGTYLSWANWRESITVTHRWMTSVFGSVNSTESRKKNRWIPQRELDYTTLFSGSLPTQQQWALMQSLSLDAQYLPLLTDMSIITANTTSNTIPCDTTTRNFQTESYAVLCHVASYGGLGYAFDQPTTQYYPVYVIGVTDTTLTLNSSVPEEFMQGDLVFPAIYIEKQLKASPMKLFSDTKGTTGLKVTEVFADTVLKNANSSYSPTMYHGYADLEFVINWADVVSMEIISTDESEVSGKYRVLSDRGGDTKTALTFLTSAMSREATWELRGKLTYLAGMYSIVWIKNPLDFLSVGPTQSTLHVDVISAASEDTTETIKGLYIENAVGDKDFIQGTMALTSGVYVFTFKEATTVTNITIVRQAFLMRSRKDKTQQRWYAFDVMDTVLQMIEVVKAYV